MAIGTPGGKLGCAVGPIVGIFMMLLAVDWFGITEDSTDGFILVGWLLFGLGMSIIAGLLLRRFVNSLFGAEPPGF